MKKTIVELQYGTFNKRDLFVDIDYTFDWAVPQNWLDSFADWAKVYTKGFITYHLILSSVVWGYPGNNPFGMPIFGCIEIERLYFNIYCPLLVILDKDNIQ